MNIYMLWVDKNSVYSILPVNKNKDYSSFTLAKNKDYSSLTVSNNKDYNSLTEGEKQIRRKSNSFLPFYYFRQLLLTSVQYLTKHTEMKKM